MQTAPHIVVVEDDDTQRDLLAAVLEHQGFRVSGVRTGEELRSLLQHDAPALVMLDVQLPGEDGFSLARFVRDRAPQSGIMMVTSAVDTADRVVGLDAGADDYIVKPLELPELLARVRSVLRRVQPSCLARASATVSVGRRVLDIRRGLLLEHDGGGEGEKLAASEMSLLQVFVANPHRPLERDWLMEVTSHRERHELDRAIDLRIARLRRKVERDARRPRTIRTVRGIGYMFVPESA